MFKISVNLPLVAEKKRTFSLAFYLKFMIQENKITLSKLSLYSSYANKHFSTNAKEKKIIVKTEAHLSEAFTVRVP